MKVRNHSKNIIQIILIKPVLVTAKMGEIYFQEVDKTDCQDFCVICF